jgi:hypothetical protein
VRWTEVEDGTDTAGEGAASQLPHPQLPSPPATARAADAKRLTDDEVAVTWGGKLFPVPEASPSGRLQIPILARVRALEERIPGVERGVRRYLPAGEALPSRGVGQGTLIGRVEALEKAMATLLYAQEVAISEGPAAAGRGGDGVDSGGCCACCSIM